jgi:putative membrane protein
MNKSRWLLIVLGLAALGGCSKDEGSEAQPAAASQGDESTPETPATAAAQGATTAALSDAQIAQILQTVDTGEIEQAQLALSRASSPAAKQYAQMMIDEHSMSKQEGMQLAAQSGMNPSPSATSNQLQMKASQLTEQLRNADAASFDQLYMQGQLRQHQEVLNMITDKLMPSASDPALRQQLTKTQALVQRHIDHAQDMKM